MIRAFQIALAVWLWVPCLASAGSRLSQETFVPRPDASTDAIAPNVGNPGEKTVLERDRNGRAVREIVYARDGAIRQVTTYDCYDENSGHLTAWTVRSYGAAAANSYSEEKCQYDPQLQCMQRTTTCYRDGKPTGNARHRIVEARTPVSSILFSATRQVEIPARIVPVNDDFFRANEFSLFLSAGGAFGNDLQQVTTTRTVTTMTTEKVTVTKDNPSGPGTITETTSTEVKHHNKVQTTQNKGSFRGAAGKVEVQANYFLCRYFGVGVNCGYIFPQQSTLLVDGRLIARYPIEGKWHVAPYAFTGMGGEFSNESKLVGFVGGGIEKRFSPHCGVFAEARWQFDGARENIAVANVGLSIAFGPGQNPSQAPRTENVVTTEPPRRAPAARRAETAVNTHPTRPQQSAWNGVNLTGTRAKVLDAPPQ